MRDVDRFVGYFLVQTKHDATDIADFKNSKFTFGPKLSTSGHLIPRYFLARRHINPEDYFSEVTYSHRHEATAERVQDGTADIAVANSEIINRLYQRSAITAS